MSSALFSTIRVRNLEVRNRLWVPPMCQFSCENRDGLATDWHIVHQGSFAKGGAGMIFTEATAVVPEGRISPLDLGIWSDDHIEPLKKMTDFIHSQGALAAIQLAHAGRKASASWPWSSNRGSIANEDGGWDTYGTTDEPFGYMKAPIEASKEYIQQIVHEFLASAKRAVQAGYDMVEVHAAHGYFIHTFLSPYTNKRTDEYGGSREGRSLILVEIIEKIRSEFPDLPISVRFSAEDYIEGGLTPHEVGEIGLLAATAGADFFDISTGGLIPGVEMELYPGYQTDAARIVREMTGLYTSAVGLITEPEHAESLIRSGTSDVVMIGREFLRNPHFGIKAAAALGEPARFTPKQYQRAPYPSSVWLNHIEHVTKPKGSTS